MSSGAGAGVTFSGTGAGVKESDTNHLCFLSQHCEIFFLPLLTIVIVFYMLFCYLLLSPGC